MMMSALLRGILETKTERPVLGEAIWVRVTITNVSDQTVVIVDPKTGVPAPDLHWSASDQAYQIALLMSFGLLQITLKDANGHPLESKGLMPWVTPILGKRALHLRDSFVLDFDLNELFSIDLAGLYSVHLWYGDDAAYAEGDMDLDISPRETV